MKHLVLIGMMGSGKTTVGRALADKLTLPVLDTDTAIEQMQGLSVAEIFKLSGEKQFRKLEAMLVERLKGMPTHIVSTGGGIILNGANTLTLKEIGVVIYLKASLQTLEKNLSGEEDSRPLLINHSLEALLKVRSPLYEGAAHGIIEIDGKTVEEIVHEIFALYTGIC